MPSLKGRALAAAKRAYLAVYTNPAVARTITRQFTRLYYQTPVPVRTWHDTTWLGVPVLKTPLDLWNYQELVVALRPDLVVETGTAGGGSALYFASLLDLLGAGRVLTVDVQENEDRPAHARIEYLVGSSVDAAVLARVAARVAEARRVLVVLDSDHTMPHVLAELRAYAGFVTPGSYLIVEDTCINGHPVAPQFGPGPMEAVRAFLREDDRFVQDGRDRKFLMTFNPGGYLRRVR